MMSQRSRRLERWPAPMIADVCPVLTINCPAYSDPQLTALREPLLAHKTPCTGMPLRPAVHELPGLTLR